MNSIYATLVCVRLVTPKAYVCSIVMRAQIQPFGGGLLDIVPAPSGIRAVGLGAARAGVPGSDAVGEPTDVTGVTGFMRSPLMTAAGVGAEGWVAVFGVESGERGGGGGSTFSRCAFKYALLC